MLLCHLLNSDPICLPFSPLLYCGAVSALLVSKLTSSGFLRLCLVSVAQLQSPFPPHLCPSHPPSPHTLDELTQGSITPITQAGAQGSGSGSALPRHLGTVEVSTVVPTQVAEAGQVLFPEACAEALQEHQWLLMIQLTQDGHLLTLCQVRLTLLLAAHRQVAGSDGMQHGTHSWTLSLGGFIIGDSWCILFYFLVLGCRWNQSLAQLPPVCTSGLHVVCKSRGVFS